MMARILVLLFFVSTCNNYDTKIEGSYSINYFKNDSSGIKGVILSKETKEPINHAILIIDSIDTILVNSKGEFDLILDEGQYSISVKAIGFRKNIIKKVLVKPNNKTYLVVNMGSDVIY